MLLLIFGVRCSCAGFASLRGCWNAEKRANGENYEWM